MDRIAIPVERIDEPRPLAAGFTDLIVWIVPRTDAFVHALDRAAARWGVSTLFKFERT